MYGNAFAETFPMEYTKKYHTTEASNMSTDWLGPRLYRPKPQEVYRGALTSDTEDVHYVTTFRYPKRGGFVSFLSGLIAGSRIEVDHCVEQIDVAERTIEFANGVMVEYDHLISSMPLPELVPRLKDVDPKVRDAAARLSCTSCVVVNLGIDREDISDNHWTYFYDEDFCFARLSFPHMFAASNAPPGCGSIQAEVYFSAKYRPFDGDLGAVKQKVLADLRRCGLVQEDDKVMLCTAKYLPYANVIFDLDRKESLGIVHDYLDEHDVHYCGRYGDWKYIWTDQSFISGMKAADSVSSAL
jgi:protoporphyrinogen oxidase